jgi:hypothetical protein
LLLEAFRYIDRSADAGGVGPGNESMIRTNDAGNIPVWPFDSPLKGNKLDRFDSYLKKSYKMKFS